MTPSDDSLSRAALARSRAIATGLLAVVAAIFLVAEILPGEGFWIELLRHGSEAALVGGLADWFAVTALFRRPLGLPIPHTAILPNNKDRIGDAIGGFISGHFFQPELIKERLATIDPAGRSAAWLVRADNAELVADRIVGLVPGVLGSTDDEEVRRSLVGILRERLERTDLADTMASGLEIVMEGRHHQRLFTDLVDLAGFLLVRHEDDVRAMVADRRGWWLPGFIDRRLARLLIDEAVLALKDLREPDPKLRWHVDETLVRTVDRLRASESTRAGVERFKQRLLANPRVEAHLSAAWDELRALLMSDVEAEDSRLRRAVAQGLRSLADSIAQDDALRRQTNRRIRTFVIVNVTPWQGEIGNFISEVVRSWDAATVTQRLEQTVGRDLQFIRVSGTVVGAVVGCLLYLLISVINLF